MSSVPEPATVVIMFWKFLIIHRNFLLPQVKWSMIISNKNGTLMLPPEMPNECGSFVGLM